MAIQIDISEKVLVYKTVDNRNIELIFLPPKKKMYQKAPVIFIISGGGWHSESKISMFNYAKVTAEILREMGWAIVSVDYRVVKQDMSVKGDISIAEIVDDNIDALSYLAENSNELGIDAEKIIVLGHSAGAHLSSLLAFADAKIFKGSDFVQKYNIIGNIPLSPITFLYLDGNCKKPMEFNHNFIFYNKEYDDKIAHLYSPYDYITENSTPSLFIHGTHDDLVNCENSVLSFKKGKNLGADFELLTPVNAGHAFECKNENSIYPSYDLCQRAMAAWCCKILNK